MAVIKVYPDLSPRIIEVLAPDTEISLQEIVDLVRAYEDTNIGMHYPFLIDASGKEDLGGGVEVGITAELQNAQIAFAQRTADDSNGTATSSTVTVVDRITLIDSFATFEADGIVPGDTIINRTDQSISTVIAVDSEIQLVSFPLEGGTDDDWDSGDVYTIWNKVPCTISGGNLVAVDDVGASIEAALPTAFVYLKTALSSSTTIDSLAEQDLSIIKDQATLGAVRSIT